MKRKIGLSLLAFLVISVAVFFAGPRVDVSYHPRALALPTDLDAYLHREEAQFTNLALGAQKTIKWARPDKAKTPISIVYLHGFSATRQETAPLCDQVAASLGANLFYTRLTGHGLDGQALAHASVNAWLNDAMEALVIGERLGDQVLVVGCSTGGALAAWLAANAPHHHVLGYVLISANFAPQNHSTRLLTWPWAHQFIPLLFGKERQSPPINDRHAQYWTIKYPTVALIPMMGLCSIAQRLPLEQVNKPLLMIYSPQDRVVDVPAMERAYARWSGSAHKEIFQFTPTESRETHVLAGDIRAPSGTHPIEEAIVRFVHGIGR